MGALCIPWPVGQPPSGLGQWWLEGKSQKINPMADWRIWLGLGLCNNPYTLPLPTQCCPFHSSRGIVFMFASHPIIAVHNLPPPSAQTASLNLPTWALIVHLFCQSWLSFDLGSRGWGSKTHAGCKCLMRRVAYWSLSPPTRPQSSMFCKSYRNRKTTANRSCLWISKPLRTKRFKWQPLLEKGESKSGNWQSIAFTLALLGYKGTVLCTRL